MHNKEQDIKLITSDLIIDLPSKNFIYRSEQGKVINCSKIKITKLKAKNLMNQENCIFTLLNQAELERMIAEYTLKATQGDIQENLINILRDIANKLSLQAPKINAEIDRMIMQMLFSTRENEFNSFKILDEQNQHILTEDEFSEMDMIDQQSIIENIKKNFLHPMCRLLHRGDLLV